MNEGRGARSAPRVLIAAGTLAALSGLGILLGQTIHVLEPSITVSLAAFTLAFGGALLGVIGVLRKGS